MNSTCLQGIIPPLPTPLLFDESIDTQALRRLIEHQIGAGVHGLWVLGTTARFDLLPDSSWRTVAETAADQVKGRLPLVLNVSDQGTRRTRVRASMFDDLPFDYYAALCPWYQPMTSAEVTDFFLALADTLARPVVIYNAPWVCNQLGFAHLRKLAEHPRIIGCKDVTPSLVRALEFPVAERRALNFRYLHGNDQIATSSALEADGFVSALSNALPELAVAIWDAVHADDADRGFRLQSQFLRISRAVGFGPMHACLEQMMKHRGFLDRMLPAPLRSLDAATARQVLAVLDSVGVLPEMAGSL